MDDAAAACGISKVVLYRHFESKEALIHFLLDRVTKRLLAPSGPWQGFGSGLRRALAIAREEPYAFLVLVQYAASEPVFRPYIEAVRNRVVERASVPVAEDDPLGEVCAEAVATFFLEGLKNHILYGDAEDDERFLIWASNSMVAMYKEYRSR